MLVDPTGSRGASLEVRCARLATATLFFANGCGLGSWLPHIPDVRIWHGLSDGVLGLALLAIAGGAVASLPVAGALTARYGSRPTARVAALLFCAVLPLPLLAVRGDLRGRSPEGRRRAPVRRVRHARASSACASVTSRSS